MAQNKISFFVSLASCFIFSNFLVSNSFAITSSASSEGTSTTSGSIKRIFSQTETDRLQLFVDQNFERLQEASARGSGVVLNDYVSLIGCKNSDNMMGKAIQTNYQQLFKNGKAEVVQKTEQMIGNDSKLTLACENRS